jgi:Family of unknown function (DUF6279)
MRFPVNFGQPEIVKAQSGLRFPHRIIGALGMLALAGLLQACSAMKLAYNQAPDLAYWYLDSHLNLTNEQSLRVKASLAQLQAWHRQTQLPAYVGALQQLQQQLAADTTPAQACAVAADVRSNLEAISRQAEPLAAALVGTLDASQLRHLAQKFAKKNAEDEAERLGDSPKARLEKRYDQAVGRAERLYGTLNDAQRAMIARRLDQSRFDARLFFAEKQRRQRDTLNILQPLTAGQASQEQALAALRGLAERALVSPDPTYRTYLEQLGQENCQTFADLHNSTTAAQRSKAVETLRGYAQDFRTLNARNS